MIGSSKNSTETYPRKCFWTQEKETRVNFNPGLSANRPSNNSALCSARTEQDLCFRKRICNPFLRWSFHFNNWKTCWKGKYFPFLLINGVFLLYFFTFLLKDIDICKVNIQKRWSPNYTLVSFNLPLTWAALMVLNLILKPLSS